MDAEQTRRAFCLQWRNGERMGAFRASAFARLLDRPFRAFPLADKFGDRCNLASRLAPEWTGASFRSMRMISSARSRPAYGISR